MKTNPSQKNLRPSGRTLFGIGAFFLVSSVIAGPIPSTEWSGNPLVLKEWHYDILPSIANHDLTGLNRATQIAKDHYKSLKEIPHSPMQIIEGDLEAGNSVFVFSTRIHRSEPKEGLLSVYLPFCPSGCSLHASDPRSEKGIFEELEEIESLAVSSKPRIVAVDSGEKRIELNLFVRPFNGPRHFPENPIFGTFEEIQKVFLGKALRVLLFSSLELFSFIFFAFIYIRRPQDKFNLSFSLLNLSLAIWYPSYEGWSQYVLDSPWTWVIFGYSLGAFLPVLFYEFTIGIFQAPRGRIGRTLQFLFLLLTIWPSLEFGLTGGHHLFGKIAFHIFLVVLGFFYLNTLYIFYRYSRNSILSFPWVVTGLILVAVSSFYTVLSFAGFGQAQPWVNESFLGLTLLFSLALAKRYAEVFRALEKSEGKLKSLNESLETKVEERTRIIELQKAELVQKGRILAKDLSIAGKIQTALLPRELPYIPSAKISYRYRPMMEIGGDLLDVLYDSKTNCLGMFIGDVTGHGVSAALLASMLKMTLGEWSTRLQDPASLLLHIRNQFEGKLDGHFITATLVTLDLNTGQALIANAGHPECLVLRKEGRVEFYRPKGVAIYESIPTTYQTEAVELFPGDKVVLYTDGIPDSRNSNGEFFGEERLADLLKRYSQTPPEELCDSVLGGVQSFQGENNTPLHQDDMALLVAEFLG